jgi:hypothetical protein
LAAQQRASASIAFQSPRHCAFFFEVETPNFFFAGFYNDLGLDALALAESNGSVVMVHAAPGFVKTSWGTEMPW